VVRAQGASFGTPDGPKLFPAGFQDQPKDPKKMPQEQPKIPDRAVYPNPNLAPGGIDKKSDQGGAAAFSVRTDLPDFADLIRRDSETSYFRRVEQETRTSPHEPRLVLPETAPLSKEPFRPRTMPRMVELVEPIYLCHRRLYFEQPNFERLGYNFGILQPALSLGVFYYDLAMFPYHFWSDPHCRLECNVGKCLPGDCAPLLLYRERFSPLGVLGTAGTVVGGLYLFP
jgi:hypothetical protein